MRDLSRDQKLFNCNQEHELNYVAGLYANRQEVYDFLKRSCACSLIFHSTHQEVYDMIKRHLGYTVPN